MLPFSVLSITRGFFKATVAQLAEQLICNQRVGGSIPFGGSRPIARRGEVPERPKGADCKSAGAAFGGSNPPLSTSKLLKESLQLKVKSLKKMFLKLLTFNFAPLNFLSAGVAQW